ncbi:MAG: ComEC/Rec2 family competence protein, partial [Oscillospiraceae bacterium]
MRNFRNKSAVMCSLISSLAALLLMWAACSVRDVQIERISGKRQESRVVVTGVRRDCEIPRITARVYSVFGSKMLGITTSFSSKEELRAGEIADLTLEFDRIAPDDRSAPLDVSSKLIAIKDRRGIDRLCAAVCSLRDSMTRAVRDTIKDKEECALCTAVITGHRDLVSVETRIALARAGVSHILAVSGLHITAILGAVFWLLRKSGTPRSLSFVIATLMGR